MERCDSRDQSAAEGAWRLQRKQPIGCHLQPAGNQTSNHVEGFGSGSGPACVPTVKPRVASAAWSISRRLFMADVLTLKQESRGVTNEIKSGSITPARREPAGSGQKLNPVTFNTVSHTCDRR